MTKKERFMLWLLRNGEAFTIADISGTVCPCMAYRAQGYSAQYHIDFPLAAKCNGTGLINTSSVTVNLKGIFYDAVLAINRVIMSEDMKTEIGKIKKDAVILVGTVNTATNAYYDLSTLVEREDTLTWSGNTYKIRKVYPLENVGQQALLERRS